MNNFCECSDLKDKNQRIHELEEKICAYKAKVRDLYQVDISDLKKTIRCLKERIEELECENENLNEFVAPTKVLLIFHDDTNQFEFFCNDHEISDQVYDALKQAERRIDELRVENEKLKRENKKLEAQLAVREAPSIWEHVVFSYPKDKKISSMELYFQEENKEEVTE